MAFGRMGCGLRTGRQVVISKLGCELRVIWRQILDGSKWAIDECVAQAGSDVKNRWPDY